MCLPTDARGVVVCGGKRVCWAKLVKDMEVKVLSHQSRSGQVRTESCVRIGNGAFDAVDRSRAGCRESAPKESEVVEAECVRLHEGSMCTTVNARWCRSTGVVA